MFGLASDGVYMCPSRYLEGGSLLHCLSTLTCFHAVYFCCTVPEVAFAGRYPAPCPLKPGLSSPASLRTAAATICLTQNLFILAYIYFDVQTCVYISGVSLLAFEVYAFYIKSVARSFYSQLLLLWIPMRTKFPLCFLSAFFLMLFLIPFI